MVRSRRFLAQLLDRRSAGDVTGVIRRLLAVQAQDPAAFPLAVRARVTGVTATDLMRAREARTIVRCWGPRGTLHLTAVEDLAWLYPLVKPGTAGSVRRLRQLGTRIDPDNAASLVDAALRGQGPLTKTQLGERLTKAGLPVTGQAIVHMAFLGAAQGLVVLGPEQGGKASYVHAGDWLGAPLPTRAADREAALRMLTVRYQAAHHPCTAADLAAWSGLPLGEIALVWTASADHATETPRLPVRLVPAYDEYLLGWQDRDHAVPGEYRRLVHPGGGIIRSAVLADGLAVATWQARRTNGRVGITVSPFGPLPDDIVPEIEAEAADIGAFLGLRATLRPLRATTR